MQVHWVVDTLLDERAEPTGLPTLSESVRAVGHVLHEVRYRQLRRSFEPEIDIDDPATVVFHGTHEGYRELRRRNKNRIADTNASISAEPILRPLGYCRYENLSYAGFASHIGSRLLNSDFVMIPVGEIQRRCAANPVAFLDQFGGSAFIRPNAVTKSFAARVLTLANVDIEMRTLAEIEVVAPDTLAVVTRQRDIEFEFRFVIANGVVVAQSQYQRNGEPDIRPDVAPEARILAATIARQNWQADTVYVCDIGILRGGSLPYVIELNSFSCAGLYACDTRAIVDAVSAAAIREFQGDPDP